MWSPHQNKHSGLSGTVWSKLEWYQKDAVQKALKVKTLALFMEQGTGKTWVAGGVIEQLVSPSFTGIVVANLNNLDTTWFTFVRTHLPQIKLCKSLKHFKVAKTPKLLVTHYEGLKSSIKWLRKQSLTLIAYDEAQRLKTRSTQQSRDAAKLAGCAPYKMILTGTPIEEYPLDLWAQFRFLKPGLLGLAWKDFARQFMTNPIDFKKYRPGSFKFRRAIASGLIKKPEFNFKKLPQFLDLIRPYSLRVDASVLGLEDMTIEPTPVDLLGYQRRLYDEMDQNFLINRRRLKVTASLTITQIGKLQQLSGGFVYDDRDQLHYVGRAKLRKTKYLLKRSTGPWLVFCKYRPEIDMLASELKGQYNFKVIHGGIKKADRVAIVRSFQSGKLDGLICQLKTGGVGLDLYASNYVVCYSISHSRIDFEQLRKRVHRRGQTRAVRLFLLYGVGTIDENLIEIVSRKNRSSDRTLTPLIQRRRS